MEDHVDEEEHGLELDVLVGDGAALASAGDERIALHVRQTNGRGVGRRRLRPVGFGSTARRGDGLMVEEGACLLPRINGHVVQNAKQRERRNLFANGYCLL